MRAALVGTLPAILQTLYNAPKGITIKAWIELTRHEANRESGKQGG